MAFDPTPLRDPLHAAVLEAGRRALELRAAFLETGRIGVEVKEDRSPVTEADEASHRVLASALPGVLDVPVVSEEGAERGVGDGGRFWLVDPLDGTKEFLRGRDEWTVNVALVDAGRAVAGMVHAPVLGVSWWGAPGGAWRWEEAGVTEAGGAGGGPAWTPIHCAEPRDACRVVASVSHRGPDVDRYVAALRADGLEVSERSYGSSLKVCRVAEGAADVYPRLGPTMQWDTAAADAVLRGAGGSLVDPEGRPLRYDGARDWRNPHFLAGGPGRDWTRYL